MKFKAKRKRVQQRHNGQQWFKCDYCERSFSRRINLQSHIFTHTGERPFQCDHCDKKYTSYNNLKQHMKLHGKAKCYECKKCNQSFQSLSALGKHENTHNYIHYHCNICMKAFPTKVLFHSHGCPFECEFCGKWFKHYMALSSHIEKEHLPIDTNLKFRTDNNYAVNNLNGVPKEGTEQLEVFKEDKLHVCRICGREFKDEISLIFHIKIHGDGDPCECMVCGATFPTEIIRTYHHMKLHTGAIDWQNIESGRKNFKQVYQVLVKNS